MRVGGWDGAQLLLLPLAIAADDAVVQSAAVTVGCVVVAGFLRRLPHAVVARAIALAAGRLAGSVLLLATPLLGFPRLKEISLQIGAQPRLDDRLRLR